MQRPYKILVMAMQFINLKSAVNSIPNEVAWEDVVQLEQLYDRVAIANDFCPNIVGVNDGCIEWCLKEEPPSDLEKLVWWWVVRPDLGAAVALEAPLELKRIIGNCILVSY